jgi:BMFP domain-containing protein YqiC
VDPTLKTIIEFRNEMREFRAETRSTLGQHSHRLNLIEATIASLKADAGVLLGSVPVQNERLDQLEARVAALEARS